MACQKLQNPRLYGQKLYGEKSLIALLAFLNAFIPLSNDMYLPTLPQMTVFFHTTPAVMSLTISLFFVFFSGGALFWGPISDKYGRKHALLIGLSAYTLSSLACIFAETITLLVILRCVQALGCGATTIIVMAIIKDVFTGRKRASYIALINSLMMISPVIAPSIGAVISSAYSWRAIFGVLGCIGVIAIVGIMFLGETLENRNHGNLLAAIGRFKIILKNPAFSSLLMTFSLVILPVMAFISGSPYIYITKFGLTEQIYSYYFAFNAIVAVIGPIVYIQLSKHINSNNILKAGYLLMCISGTSVCIFGNLNPFVFAICLALATLAVYVFYPYTINLMLEQQRSDTGTATSLIFFVNYIIGGIGMELISFGWKNQIFALGMMNLLAGAISLLLFLIISSKVSVKQVSVMVKN